MLRTQLAKLYANKDRFDEAIDELHIAISLNPQDCAEATNVSRVLFWCHTELYNPLTKCMIC